MAVLLFAHSIDFVSAFGYSVYEFVSILSFISQVAYDLRINILINGKTAILYLVLILIIIILSFLTHSTQPSAQSSNYNWQSSGFKFIRFSFRSKLKWLQNLKRQNCILFYCILQNGNLNGIEYENEMK